MICIFCILTQPRRPGESQAGWLAAMEDHQAIFRNLYYLVLLVRLSSKTFIICCFVVVEPPGRTGGPRPTPGPPGLHSVSNTQIQTKQIQIKVLLLRHTKHTKTLQIENQGLVILHGGKPASLRPTWSA